jgi:hypothetical protein
MNNKVESYTSESSKEMARFFGLQKKNIEKKLKARLFAIDH